MTKTKWYVMVLACLFAAFFTGCVSGLFMSTRNNTYAAIYYAQALDVEARELAHVELAKVQTACNASVKDITQKMVINDGMWKAKYSELVTTSSEQVIGLRTQLAAHGIRERLVVRTK